MQLRHLESLSDTDADVRRRLYWRAFFRVMRDPSTWLASLLGWPTLLGAMLLLRAPIYGSVSLYIWGTGLLVAGLPLFLISLRVTMRKEARICGEVIRESGRCGECGYDLRSVSSHGAEMVCPECGAANAMADDSASDDEST